MRLDDPAAAALARLVEVFEDLQTVLRCCERLVGELAVESGPDEVVVEAVWTTALLSYARCFAGAGEGAALNEDDVRTTHWRPTMWSSGIGCCCSCGITTPIRT